MLIRLSFLAGTVTALLAAAAAPAIAQSRSEPLARFSESLCPGVAGLQREAAEAVVGRMRANAEAFGIRLADEGDCEANVLIVVVDDGRAFLQRMGERQPHLFAEIDKVQRDALMSAPGPARVFLRTRDYSRDGMPIYRRDNLVDVPRTEMWMAHSKIYTATRRDIHTALVVVDRAGVAGVTLDQLADFASLRAFAQRQPRAAPGQSIGSLFDTQEDRPAGLTPVDRAFLTALYGGIANLPGAARLAEIEKATRRAGTR